MRDNRTKREYNKSVSDDAFLDEALFYLSQLDSEQLKSVRNKIGLGPGKE